MPKQSLTLLAASLLLFVASTTGQSYACGPDQHVYLADNAASQTTLVVLPYPPSIGPGTFNGGIFVADALQSGPQVASMFDLKAGTTVVNNQPTTVVTLVDDAADVYGLNNQFTLLILFPGIVQACIYTVFISRRAVPQLPGSDNIIVFNGTLAETVQIASFTVTLSQPATQLSFTAFQRVSGSIPTAAFSINYTAATNILVVSANLSFVTNRLLSTANATLHVQLTDNGLGRTHSNGTHNFTSYHNANAVVKLDIQLDLDRCQPNPCQHGGTCLWLLGDFSCACPVLYAGKACQVLATPCTLGTHNCSANAKCNAIARQAFSCTCNFGYTGDGAVCNNINDCLGGPCQNGGTCSDGIGKYSCQCLRGFTGQNCEIVPCGPARYVYLADNAASQTTLVILPYPLFIGVLPAAGITIVDALPGRPRVAAMFGLKAGITASTGQPSTIVSKVSDAANLYGLNSQIALLAEFPGSTFTCAYSVYILRRAIPRLAGSSKMIVVKETLVNTVQLATFSVILSEPATHLSSNVLQQVSGSIPAAVFSISYTPAKNILTVSANLTLIRNPFFTTMNATLYLKLIDNGHNQSYTRGLNTFKAYHNAMADVILHVQLAEGPNRCQPNPCQHTGICTRLIGDFSCACPAGYSGKACQTTPCLGGTHNCSPNATCSGLVPKGFACTCNSGFTGNGIVCDAVCGSDQHVYLADNAANQTTLLVLPYPPVIGVTTTQDVIIIDAIPSNPRVADMFGLKAGTTVSGGKPSTIVSTVSDAANVYGLNKQIALRVIFPGNTFNCTYWVFVSRRAAPQLQGSGNVIVVKETRASTLRIASLSVVLSQPATKLSSGVLQQVTGSIPATVFTISYTKNILTVSTNLTRVRNPFFTTINATLYLKLIDNGIGRTYKSGPYTFRSYHDAAADIKLAVQFQEGPNRCQPNPCLHTGACTRLIGDFSCACPTGYTGKACDTTPCVAGTHNCSSNAMCNDVVPQGFSCTCNSGFTGDGVVCNDIDYCEPEPCVNGTCQDGVIEYTCQCVSGFTGANCQTDINECAGDPCKNGGTCTDGIDTYSCQCARGFTGPACGLVACGPDQHVYLADNASSQTTLVVLPYPSSIGGTSTQGISVIDLSPGLPPVASMFGLKAGTKVTTGQPSTIVSTVSDAANVYGLNKQVGILIFFPGNAIWCVYATYISRRAVPQLLGSSRVLVINETLAIDVHVASLTVVLSQPATQLSSIAVQTITGSIPAAVFTINYIPLTNVLTVSANLSLVSRPFFSSRSAAIHMQLVDNGRGQNYTSGLNTFKSYHNAMTDVILQVQLAEGPNRCQPNPCQHTGTCTRLIGDFSCACPAGYSGKACQITPCMSGTHHCSPNATCSDLVPKGFSCTCNPGFTGDGVVCNDIDYCVPEPCVNGTCLDGAIGYTCQCASGFTGHNCQANINDCLGVLCQNGGACRDGIGKYFCQCVPGFTGLNCQTDINDCFGDPCQNGGTCRDGIGKYSCQCVPGFTGQNCQTDINDCFGDPCQNGGTCRDGIGKYSCQCVPGFTGQNCQTDINDCFGDPCQNGGTCRDEIGRYSCQCALGFTGQTCQTDIYEGSGDLCQNGGTFTIGVGRYYCQCVPGFTGQNCQTDVNECFGDPCQNGGTCRDGIGRYSCQCVLGFTGQMCQTDIDYCVSQPCVNVMCLDGAVGYACQCAPDINDCSGVPCRNGGTCTDAIGRYSCQCLPGFTGQNCQTDIDYCVSQPCVNGMCVDGAIGYACQCVPGFTGTHCQTDIDDCSGVLCQNGGSCTDEIDRYYCQCIHGFTGQNCQTNNNECSGVLCQNGGTCRDEIGRYSCQCLPGFTGQNCQTDVNECFGVPCQHNGTCRDGIGRYSCQCVPGFTGQNCQTDIDYCVPEPCVNGTCLDGPIGYTCRCASGFTGSNCQTDINDCLRGACQNGGTCRDGVGNYSCQCLPGFTGENCQADIYEGSGDLCQNGGTFTIGVGRYSCQCVPGFTGQNCQTDINECSGVLCQNGGTCRDEIGRYSCQCTSAYSGSNCQYDITQCGRVLCQNGGTCIEGIDTYSCQCVPGFTGHNCQYDIDECNVMPCQNGGTCFDARNTYVCKCVPGFGGAMCETGLRDKDSGNTVQEPTSSSHLTIGYALVGVGSLCCLLTFSLLAVLCLVRVHKGRKKLTQKRTGPYGDKKHLRPLSTEVGDLYGPQSEPMPLSVFSMQEMMGDDEVRSPHHQYVPSQSRMASSLMSLPTFPREQNSWDNKVETHAMAENKAYGLI